MHIFLASGTGFVGDTFNDLVVAVWAPFSQGMTERQIQLSKSMRGLE
jgi:hypothetical protein